MGWTIRVLAVATGGTSHRDTIAGMVILRATTDTTNADAILVGSADSNIAWPRYLAFAHSPALRGPPRDGIEVRYARGRGAITLVFGNSVGTSGAHTTDSGVFVEVFTIDNAGIISRWVDGGLGVLVDSGGHDLGHPQGFFCLRRVGP